MSTSTDSEWANFHGSTRSTRIAYLFQSGLHSDVKLIVGDKKEKLKAHKLILMAISPVFEQVFLEDSTIVELEIPEFEPKIFRLFLQFVYTGEWSKNWKDVLPLLNVANFYKLPDLSELCTTYLKSALTFKTALPIFQQSVQYKEKDLEEAAVTEICKNAHKFVESEEFLGLSSECVQKLLKQDDLAVFDEVQLFDALVRWAEAECTRLGTPTNPKYCRSVLEKLIIYIRFTEMTQFEFTIKVTAPGFLTTEEAVSVYAYQNIPTSLRSTSNTPPILFNTNPREYCEPTEEFVLVRLPTVDDNTNLPEGEYSICFKVDGDLWMTSIGLNHIHNKYKSSPMYAVQVVVVDTETNYVKTEKSEIVEAANNTTDHYQVKFEEDVKIKKDIWYQSIIRIKGTYFGANYTNTNNFEICKAKGCKPVRVEFKNGRGPTDLTTTGQMATLGFLLYKI